MVEKNNRLVGKFAFLWLEEGGDSEDFAALWGRILERIKDIESYKAEMDSA